MTSLQWTSMSHPLLSHIWLVWEWWKRRLIEGGDEPKWFKYQDDSLTVIKWWFKVFHHTLAYTHTSGDKYIVTYPISPMIIQIKRPKERLFTCWILIFHLWYLSSIVILNFWCVTAIRLHCFSHLRSDVHLIWDLYCNSCLLNNRV